MRVNTRSNVTEGRLRIESGVVRTMVSDLMDYKPMKRLGIAGIILAALLPGQAAAHPHVWVNTVVGLVFEKDSIAAVRLEWTFDALFTGIILADFDTDQNNALDAGERAKAAEAMSTVLPESRFFTHIRLDAGDELPIESVDDFSVSLREGDGRAVIEFVVPLDEPVNPEQLSVAVYDMSNYVSFAYDPVDPVRYLGDGNLGCVPTLVEDPENTYYFGFVTPSKVELNCAAS